MNMDFLTEYMIPIVIGMCLCIGYLIKSWNKVPNNAIPTILVVVGVVFALWVNSWSVTPEIILSGFVSALASCKLYDLFKEWLEKRGEK